MKLFKFPGIKIIKQVSKETPPKEITCPGPTRFKVSVVDIKHLYLLLLNIVKRQDVSFSMSEL